VRCYSLKDWTHRFHFYHDYSCCYLCLYTYKYTYIYIHEYTHIYIYISIYIYIYIYTYNSNMNTYTYIHIKIQWTPFFLSGLLVLLSMPWFNCWTSSRSVTVVEWPIGTIISLFRSFLIWLLGEFWVGVALFIWLSPGLKISSTGERNSWLPDDDEDVY
jgi:hypothetical protein